MTHGGVLLLYFATLPKLTPVHGCCSRFLNCTNGTKSRNTSHILESLFSSYLSSSYKLSVKEGVQNILLFKYIRRINYLTIKYFTLHLVTIHIPMNKCIENNSYASLLFLVYSNCLLYYLLLPPSLWQRSLCQIWRL